MVVDKHSLVTMIFLQLELLGLQFMRIIKEMLLQ